MDYTGISCKTVPGNRPIKNCPILKIEGRKQVADIVAECNFDFDQEFYKDFQDLFFKIRVIQLRNCVK